MKLKWSSERVLDEWGGNRECLLSEEVFPGAWHADPGSREHSGLSAMGWTVTLLQFSVWNMKSLCLVGEIILERSEGTKNKDAPKFRKFRRLNKTWKYFLFQSHLVAH